MGKHRKRRRAPRRAVRRLALVSAGLLVPLTGGAAVYAATGHAGTQGTPSALSRVRHHHAARGTTRSPSAPTQAAARPSASPTHTAASPADTRPPAPEGPRIGFSPYADVAAWPPLDLRKLPGDTHVKDFTLGFVDAGSGCSTTWGGLTPLTDALTEHRIKDAPGKVTVSFGGPHGIEPAQSCTDVGELTGAYEKALKDTGAVGLDVFLTEQTLADDAANRRRTRALAALRKDHPDVPISITLPVDGSGLSDDAMGVLRDADSAGLGVTIVNLVAAEGSGKSLIDAATAAHGQIRRLYAEDDAQAWGHMGVTPVIGVSGAGKGFQPSDAEQVLTWAKTNALGRLSMWSITRDAPCTVDTTAANDTCSGLDEDAGAFSKVFDRY